MFQSYRRSVNCGRRPPLGSTEMPPVSPQSKRLCGMSRDRPTSDRSAHPFQPQNPFHQFQCAAEAAATVIGSLHHGPVLLGRPDLVQRRPVQPFRSRCTNPESPKPPSASFRSPSNLTHGCTCQPTPRSSVIVTLFIEPLSGIECEAIERLHPERSAPRQRS
jgi:hypothetical protein